MIADCIVARVKLGACVRAVPDGVSPLGSRPISQYYLSGHLSSPKYKYKYKYKYKCDDGAQDPIRNNVRPYYHHHSAF